MGTTPQLTTSHRSITTFQPDTARLCDILAPLKQAGVPWEIAWEQCNVLVTEKEGWNSFIKRVLKSAYTNDDTTINWNSIRNWSAIRDGEWS